MAAEPALKRVELRPADAASEIHKRLRALTPRAAGVDVWRQTQTACGLLLLRPGSWMVVGDERVSIAAEVGGAEAVKAALQRIWAWEVE